MSPEELIAKLAAASGGNRELDAEIMVALDLRPDWCTGPGEIYIEKNRWWITRWRSDAASKIRSRNDSPIADFPRYTTVFEAALTLVPDEWTAWAVRSRSRKTLFTAEVSKKDEDGGEDHAIGHGATPVLALCIAAIRARVEGAP